MALSFLETKVKARDVEFNIRDLYRVMKDSWKIRWAMRSPFPGRWPTASAISHCQITQEDPLRFMVLGDAWHNFDNRPMKLKDYFGWPRARVIINPQILYYGQNKVRSIEGCYSYSNQKTRSIKRVEIVECEYWTIFGKRRKKFYLYRASLLQHEIDHMDGVGIEDRYFKKS